jgi:branched-chain amino acid aminotransferase
MQMEQVRENFFNDNGKLQPTNDFKELESPNGVLVYEVLRVVSGVPLFLEDHIRRLKNSSAKAGFIPHLTVQAIEDGIHRLISGNRVEVGNIKIIVGEQEGTVSWQAFFIPFKYPSEADYQCGVELGILSAERKNPEAKIIQPEVREKANQMLESEALYEVLLIDNEGYVREGSRSNIFFIRGETVVTPPANQVLNGITRQKVVDILHRDGYSFCEKPISLNDLAGFDAAFLTGTSPKVLPVNRIAGFRYHPRNPLCIEIIDKYDEVIKGYILSRR